MLGAGGTGGDGGDQRHADKQCGTGGGHAARILLDVRMRHLGGRPGKRNQRAHTAHQYRQPECGGKHQSEEDQRAASDGGEQYHRILLVGQRIMSGDLFVHLPGGECGQTDADEHQQTRKYGTDLTGPTGIVQFDGPQRFQWSHGGGGTCGAKRGDHGHSDAERNRHHERRPGQHQSHGHAGGFHQAGLAQRRHQSDAEAHAQHGGDESQQTSLEQYGDIQLAFVRADGAQQGKRATALGDEHLESVGDDERRDQHGEDAEAQQEDGGDTRIALAHGFDGFLFHRCAGLHGEMFWQQLVDLFHGGVGGRLIGIVDIEVDKIDIEFAEIVDTVHRGDHVIGKH